VAEKKDFYELLGVARDADQKSWQESCTLMFLMILMQKRSLKR